LIGRLASSWYNARLTLDNAGQLNADFDYDNPPFDGDANPNLLIEDQRLYPRPRHAARLAPIPPKYMAR
jgi:hypothetical protein